MKIDVRLVGRLDKFNDEHYTLAITTTLIGVTRKMDISTELAECILKEGDVERYKDRAREKWAAVFSRDIVIELKAALDALYTELAKNERTAEEQIKNLLFDNNIDSADWEDSEQDGVFVEIEEELAL